jgi:hypothetical protein
MVMQVIKRAHAATTENINKPLELIISYRYGYAAVEFSSLLSPGIIMRDLH